MLSLRSQYSNCYLKKLGRILKASAYWHSAATLTPALLAPPLLCTMTTTARAADRPVSSASALTPQKDQKGRRSVPENARSCKNLPQPVSSGPPETAADKALRDACRQPRQSASAAGETGQPPSGHENIIVTAHLDQMRGRIAPGLGAVSYGIDQRQIQATPGGENAAFSQILLRLPGVVMDLMARCMSAESMVV